MELSNQKISELTKRLLLSRTRILIKFPFYGLLLMHVGFGLEISCPTAYTDGKKIVFGVDFLEMLSDYEVDIVMMHEILHIVLKHCFRGSHLESERYNIACDIVVNSNIAHSLGLGVESIALKCDKNPLYFAPNGKEGYLYTAEEVYNMIPSMVSKNKKTTIDSHDNWGNDADGSESEVWDKRVVDAFEMSKKSGSEFGLPPQIERMIEEIKKPKKDWRTILQSFIQEEINDYSFSPPDRRYEDDFFLPDFNDSEATVKKILFMVDTSGSINIEMLNQFYSEVCGAIDQFNGKFTGWLGFFDHNVVDPKPFESIEDIKTIKPKGGGGTSFKEVFRYIRTKMQDDLPTAIIIITDGYATFPRETDAMGIPVLWAITTDVKPPFGTLIQL